MELRPTWIAVAIVTCVIFGSTVNRCLTCGQPAVASRPSVVVEDGTPFVSPAAAAEPITIEPMPKQAREPVVEAKPPGLEDHGDLSFDKLASYAYEVHELTPGMELDTQLPASVKALKGNKVAIRGFMLPYRNDGENVTEFILLQNQGLCCFGRVPRMNEWVHVKMEPGRGAPYALDVPITVFGKLDVGEVYEKNVLMSIYRMEATAVIVPPVYR